MLYIVQKDQEQEESERVVRAIGIVGGGVVEVGLFEVRQRTPTAIPDFEVVAETSDLEIIGRAWLVSGGTKFGLAARGAIFGSSDRLNATAI